MSSQNESVPRFLPLNNVCKEFRHLEFVKCCPTQKEFNIFSTSKYPEKRNADGRRERGSEEGKGLFLRGVPSPPLYSICLSYPYSELSFLQAYFTEERYVWSSATRFPTTASCFTIHLQLASLFTKKKVIAICCKFASCNIIHIQDFLV